MQSKISSKSNFQSNLNTLCEKLNIPSYNQITFHSFDGYFIAELEDSFITRLSAADPNAINSVNDH
jgi:hypothetical protein